MAKKVGVLAIQGDFEAHAKALNRAGADAIEVRTEAALRDLDGLVIPGGESTTMLLILKDEKLFEPLRSFGERKPILGTCAGAILLAKDVANPVQDSLSLMDIGVERNAYGRQLDSRVVRLTPEAPLGPEEMEAVFIRAPIIRRTGPSTKVYLRYQGDPVVVGDGRHFAVTFHPELSEDPRVHRFFLDTL